MGWPKGKKQPHGKVPGSGRKPGGLNKRTVQFAEMARTIVEDPEVWKLWLKQACIGELPTPIMQLLCHYAWGRPVERIEHSGDVDKPLVLIMRRGEDVERERSAAVPAAILLRRAEG
jgi:hypothetical protein